MMGNGGSVDDGTADQQVKMNILKHVGGDAMTGKRMPV